MGNLTSAVDEWAGEGLRALDLARLGEDLLELRRAADRLEAEFVRRLAEFDRRGGGDVDGLPTGAWLRHRCRLSPGAAAVRVAVARRLGRLPAVAAAFAAGDIGLDHVRVVALVRDPAARAAVAAAEGPIAEHAARACPAETARLVRHVVHAAAPEVLARDVEDLHGRRRLHLSETFDGAFVLDGCSTPESGRHAAHCPAPSTKAAHPAHAPDPADAASSPVG